jgi:dGTPase
VVSWADRCAYTAHDLEDAVRAGVVSLSMLPPVVVERCGSTRSRQLRAFIDGLVEGITTTGQVGMRADLAEALAALRAFNYEHIYLRPASVAQAEAVVSVLQSLVGHFADRPNTLPVGAGPGGDLGLAGGSPEAVRAAVAYVAGMTDRFAFQSALAHLGWDPSRLPAGIDTASLRRSPGA